MSCGRARRTLQQHVAHPDQDRDVVSRHVDEAGENLADVIGRRVQCDQRKFHASESAEAQSDTEALLAPVRAQVAGKHQQKQDEAALHHAHTALQGHDAGLQGMFGSGSGGSGHYSGDHQHDQAGPFEKDRAEIAECVIGTEDIEKDFVNDAETEDDTDGSGGPVEIEEDRIEARAVERKGDGKDDDLEDDIDEEDGESPVELSPQHDAHEGRLQRGMGEPEGVIREIGSRTHPLFLAVSVPIESARKRRTPRPGTKKFFCRLTLAVLLVGSMYQSNRR